MESIENLDFEKIEKSENPEIAIHVFVFHKFEAIGYNETQNWIRLTLKNWKWAEHVTVKEYFTNRVFENERFEPHKEYLFSVILKLSIKELDDWVHQMHHGGVTKQTIFDILLELFIFIQFNPITKNNDTYYDFLSDYLDGFTAWGKNFRILPDEPDCK